jgi:hypothetical protein
MEVAMGTFLLAVVSGFLLFSVLLPLLGIVIGLFCYYVLPYLFGGLVSLTVFVLAGVQILLSWWVWLAALLWASAVCLAKAQFRKIGADVEHHHAAQTVLLCGAPYRRKRAEMREALALD